jgi:rhodanese-related sulfurtransferase
MPQLSAVDGLVHRARMKIRVLAPAAAFELWRAGAVFVDIRPVAQRDGSGQISGALHIERNVLEWRLEPNGAHRHPALDGPDRAIVVYCQQGYASTLAVATLVELGLTDVYDLGGGFEAWAGADLPIKACPFSNES